MPVSVHFILNGKPVSLLDCPSDLTLLQYLRQQGLTGTKEGCAEGDCGACSVVFVQRSDNGNPNYKSVNSCIIPLRLVDGFEIITVEGVAKCGDHHPIQKKFISNHASQCGYCTPGFIMSLFEGHNNRSVHTPSDLDALLSGNLCRCTGYRPIRDVVVQTLINHEEISNAQSSLSSQPQTPQASHLLSANPVNETGDDFFIKPTSLSELLAAKHEHPDARVVAGATELGLEVSKRFQGLPKLISLDAVPELHQVELRGTEWHIGAAVTLTELDEKLGSAIPVLKQMLQTFGSRQIRNRATLGGNLATASPIGDAAPVFLALDAKLLISSATTDRLVPINEFFVSYRKTLLRLDEVLRTIIVPQTSNLPFQCHNAWFKVSKRRDVDIATVSACFCVVWDSDGVVTHVRLAYGGVSDIPRRAIQAESAILGKHWTIETLERTIPILTSEFKPLSDTRGSEDYRRGLVADLLRKFFFQTKLTSKPALRHYTGKKLVKPSSLTSNSLVVAADSHESARIHVTGEATYTDDLGQAHGCLEVWPVYSTYASARIKRLDVSQARDMADIEAVLVAEDVFGINDTGPVKKDEALLAQNEVFFHGQIVAVVVGKSFNACRAAAAKVIVDYEPQVPILTCAEALATQSFHNEPNFIRRGDVNQALSASPMLLEGELEVQGQNHFYLETQCAFATRGENETINIVSSTQNPSEVQHIVAQVLNLPANNVIVQVPRLGGGFGGKETQSSSPAAIAALATWKTGKAVRVRWNRDQDMMLTGHRHPFLAKFRAGFDGDGHLNAACIHLWANGGWSIDLSQAITDRALFHLDNAYYIPAVEFRGQVLKTNLSSNTAMRGFGGPQAMVVIEEILDRIARTLRLPPELVRERNLYRGEKDSARTHYGQLVDAKRMRYIWAELLKLSDYRRRRAEITRWNGFHPHEKRGIAITPVKFGISFTFTPLNQAGAFVLIYQDGSVQVNHGGIEMGQGLHTNIRSIAASRLGIGINNVRVMQTSTDKVPNTSATAASTGTDLNGAAVDEACKTLVQRLTKTAQQLIQEKHGYTPGYHDLTFEDDAIHDNKHPELKLLTFKELVKQAYFQRVSLSAIGYYSTPDLAWDREKGSGKPFHYFVYGAAVTEVQVDGFTGQNKVLRVDILQDAGNPVNKAISLGQVEGAFIQGMGWVTMEELKWDDKGRLLTHSPDTYKIPTIGDMPEVFNVRLLPNSKQKNVIHGAKSVGEPPFMLAISVREALRDAIASFGPPGDQIALELPATCEKIWFAIQDRWRATEGQRLASETN